MALPGSCVHSRAGVCGGPQRLSLQGTPWARGRTWTWTCRPCTGSRVPHPWMQPEPPPLHTALGLSPRPRWAGRGHSAHAHAHATRSPAVYLLADSQNTRRPWCRAAGRSRPGHCLAGDRGTAARPARRAERGHARASSGPSLSSTAVQAHGRPPPESLRVRLALLAGEEARAQPPPDTSRVIMGWRACGLGHLVGQRLGTLGPAYPRTMPEPLPRARVSRGEPGPGPSKATWEELRTQPSASKDGERV